MRSARCSYVEVSAFSDFGALEHTTHTDPLGNIDACPRFLEEYLPHLGPHLGPLEWLEAEACVETGVPGQVPERDQRQAGVLAALGPPDDRVDEPRTDTPAGVLRMDVHFIQERLPVQLLRECEADRP